MFSALGEMRPEPTGRFFARKPPEGMDRHIRPLVRPKATAHAR